MSEQRWRDPHATARLDLTPAPGSAPLHRQVAAQATMETRLLLRNGEQVVLALVIPLLVLFGGVAGADRLGLDLDRPVIDVLTPGVLALAVMSTAFASLAIATGYERRYGVLKRLGASPLPRHGLLLGKVGALLVVEVTPDRGDHRRGSRARTGTRTPAGSRRCSPWCWAPPRSPPWACSSPGLLRAEATLAAANLVYLLLVAAGGVVLPTTSYGALAPVIAWLPSGALGDALRAALHRRQHSTSPAWRCSSGWAVDRHRC